MTYTRAEVQSLMVGMQRMRIAPSDPTARAAHVVTILPAVVATHPHGLTLANRLLDAFDAAREQSDSDAKEA